MGYMHIDNLYKNQEILKDKECYALEKVHGTSAHIKIEAGNMTFFSGGEKHDRFIALFDIPDIHRRLLALPFTEIVIYGEAYGGKQQGMSHTYGTELKFIAFDVKIDGQWQEVPKANSICDAIGIEFVPWVECDTSIETLNKQRDLPSIVAWRRGIPNPQESKREGVVLRPLIERVDHRGNRVVAKHKIAQFGETKTQREVDPDKQVILENAHKVAEEFVTEMRMNHVLDKLGNPAELQRIPDVIKAMIEDVTREGAGEFVDTKDVRKAIGTAAMQMYKARVCNLPEGTA